MFYLQTKKYDLLATENDKQIRLSIYSFTDIVKSVMFILIRHIIFAYFYNNGGINHNGGTYKIRRIRNGYGTKMKGRNSNQGLRENGAAQFPRKSFLVFQCLERMAQQTFDKTI